MTLFAFRRVALAARVALVATASLASGVVSTSAEAAPAGRQDVATTELAALIDRLGDVDYDVRTSAARTVRRAPQAVAVPVLAGGWPVTTTDTSGTGRWSC